MNYRIFFAEGAGSAVFESEPGLPGKWVKAPPLSNRSSPDPNAFAIRWYQLVLFKPLICPRIFWLRSAKPQPIEEIAKRFTFRP
jgi:hypothetical protein